MEVHHHPQIPHGAKKNFKEYFLEFLMIFLAVTMGFIAENLREGIGDHAKEKEYMVDMVRSLQNDTASLRAVIDVNNSLIPGIDSILALSKKSIDDEAIRRLFCQLTDKYIGVYYVFRPDDAVMQQLKNSGNLRLIKKGHVADSLTAYDLNVTAIDEQRHNFTELFKIVNDLAQQITDLTLMGDTTYFNTKGDAVKLLPPFNVDAQKMKAFYNKVVVYKKVMWMYTGELQFLQTNATNLITYLRKQYAIED